MFAQDDPTTVRCISQEGELVAASKYAQNQEHLLRWYRHMCLTRAFEDIAYNLQRTGRLGTFPGSRGQEAFYTALGSAMDDEDVLCPYYREHATFMWRGMPAWQILQYWGGDERAMAFTHKPQDLPICVPIGSQCPHGVGVATAMQLLKQPHVAVISLGDGAASTGDFCESLNLAGVKKLPAVFVINNNRLAISTPLDEQTPPNAIYNKALAAGVRAYRVDGCDVVATHETIRTALEGARNGAPALVEAMTYRICDHTTADDASRYLQPGYMEKAIAADPIERLRLYLTAKGWLSQTEDHDMQADIRIEMEQQMQRYLALPKAPVSDIFDHQYREMPAHLQRQKQQCEATS